MTDVQRPPMVEPGPPVDRLGPTDIPPAPLDPDALERSLAPFGSSRMLPRASYVDDAVLAWESSYVFDGWMCVGRSSEVAEPGSLRACSMGDYGVLLSRDKSGALHAFENTCRHRGHELLHCGGSAEPKAIVCPYHAWTYGFDGSLIGAPGFKDVAGFDRAEFGLKAVDVQEWHGWVFVDRSRRAPEFDRHIGALDEIIEPYDPGSLVTATTHDYDVAANWKVIVENYQECYHCSMIHPELCRVSSPDSGDNIVKDGNWVGGWMDLQDNVETMSLDGRSAGATMARLDEFERRTVVYLAVLPNLLISLHPDYVMTHLLTPLAPDRTRIQCSWAFPPEAVAATDFDPAYAVGFWDLTNKQDWAACESVQRGMKAPGFEPGPLAPDESGVYHFVTYMAQAYRGQSAA